MDTLISNTQLFLQPETAVTETDNSRQLLTQEDFFSLLTEQLANQDPSEPVDNDQLVAQLTSFTTADGISSLNTNFEEFAAATTSNQALQASSLIGQQVLLTGDIGYVANQGEGVSGVVIAEQSVQDLELTIQSASGEVLRVINVGDVAEGNIEFNWDGTDADGNQVPQGNYVISAQGDIGGQATLIPTAVNRHVDSVSLAGSSQGVILNLDGDVSVSLGDVIQIGS